MFKAGLVQVGIAIFCTLLYLGALWAARNIIDPVQTALLGPAFGILVFFPNGIKVLVIYAFGWLGFLYLLPVYVWLFTSFDYLNIPVPKLIFLSVLSLATPLVSAATLRWCEVTRPRSHNLVMNGKELLVVGALAALLNAFVLAWGFNHGLYEIALITLGDFLGLLCVIGATMFIYRWVRMWRRRAKSA